MHEQHGLAAKYAKYAKYAKKAPGNGNPSERGQRFVGETDFDHDRRCEAEVRALLGEGNVMDARRVAAAIKGRLDSLRVDAMIDEYRLKNDGKSV